MGASLTLFCFSHISIRSVLSLVSVIRINVYICKLSDVGALWPEWIIVSIMSFGTVFFLKCLILFRLKIVFNVSFSTVNFFLFFCLKELICFFKYDML